MIRFSTAFDQGRLVAETCRTGITALVVLNRVVLVPGGGSIPGVGGLRDYVTPRRLEQMAVRLDNVGIVVDDLPGTIATGAPLNALGYLRVMFAVDDIDGTVARLRAHGAELGGEVVRYEDAYRLCYIRGPVGLLLGLAEALD